MSGAEYDNKTEYEGIRQKYVPTIEKKGLAAVSSSFFAAFYSAFGKYVPTIEKKGARDIIGSTKKNHDK